MIIVGINAYHADSSAAIFVDGKLVAATEEERFTRIKHWAGFPKQAIEFCLKEAGVNYEKVNHWAIGRDPNAKKNEKIKFALANPILALKAVENRLKNRKEILSLDEELAKASNLPPEIFKSKIHFVEHHRSHLASAFFASPFDEAACISIDGSGDFSTTMTAIGKGNKIDILNSLNYPDSLGIFYTAFTQLLGFPYYGDEYKVMGMAPYGEPKYVSKLDDVIKIEGDFFKLNRTYFHQLESGVVKYENNLPVVRNLCGKKMIEVFGAIRKKEEPLTQYHKDLAASVQRKTESIIFEMMNKLQLKSNLENICIAGGVGQNSVANGKILSKTNFKKSYLPSAAHDAGIAMGAALYVQHQILDLPRQFISTAYTGYSSTEENTLNVLQNRGLNFEKKSDEEIFEMVTDSLINGGVVGWYNGKAEFGPRALGARSIIADPRRKDAKDLINSKIKRRESFRPFAPSILKEYAKEYFENCEDVPFMEKVLVIRKEKRETIPAVTHVDGTGRLQTVDAEIAPKYYGLIKRFHEKTGVPILLNTSFNENEPIVNLPEEALDCFLRTDMDMLVLDNFIVQKNQLQPKP